MSYYRDVYLASDHWKTLRVAKLAKHNSRCQICGHVSTSNDVHHVKYKKLWDVGLRDLRVVCRFCHNQIHELLTRFPKLKKLPTPTVWKNVKLYLSKESRLARARAEHFAGIDTLFHDVREYLVQKGVVCRRRFKFTTALHGNELFLSVLADPDACVQAYIYLTKRDPRRLIPDILRSPQTQSAPANQGDALGFR